MSVKHALLKAFPGKPTQFVPKNHPMLAAGQPGMDDLATPQVRLYARTKGFGGTGRLEYVNFGKGKVIFNTLDITSGKVVSHTASDVTSSQPIHFAAATDQRRCQGRGRQVQSA